MFTIALVIITVFLVVGWFCAILANDLPQIVVWSIALGCFICVVSNLPPML